MKSVLGGDALIESTEIEDQELPWHCFYRIEVHQWENAFVFERWWKKAIEFENHYWCKSEFLIREELIDGKISSDASSLLAFRHPNEIDRRCLKVRFTVIFLCLCYSMLLSVQRQKQTEDDLWGAIKNRILIEKSSLLQSVRSKLAVCQTSEGISYPTISSCGSNRSTDHLLWESGHMLMRQLLNEYPMMSRFSQWWLNFLR